jgi:hypothetical protein
MTHDFPDYRPSYCAACGLSSRRSRMECRPSTDDSAGAIAELRRAESLGEWGERDFRETE